MPTFVRWTARSSSTISEVATASASRCVGSAVSKSGNACSWETRCSGWRVCQGFAHDDCASELHFAYLVSVTSANPQPDAEPGDVIVNVFGRTDVGRVRDHNEDAFLVAALTADNASLQPEVRTHLVGSHGSLFMVADGLGGAAAGEVASELAILTVQSAPPAQWRSA